MGWPFVGWSESPVIVGPPAVVAPAVGAVIADTGPLTAGVWSIQYAMSSTDTAAVGKSMLLEHRNAGNTANIRLLHQMNVPFTLESGLLVIEVAASERVRAVNGVTAGAASSRYHARISMIKIA